MQRSKHLLLEKLEGNLSHNSLQLPTLGLVEEARVLHVVSRGLKLFAKRGLKNLSEKLDPGTNFATLQKIGAYLDLNNENWDYLLNLLCRKFCWSTPSRECNSHFRQDQELLTSFAQSPGRKPQRSGSSACGQRWSRIQTPAKCFWALLIRTPCTAHRWTKVCQWSAGEADWITVRSLRSRRHSRVARRCKWRFQ